MKFGMNLLLWAIDLTDDMKPLLENLKKMGFDGVEVPVLHTDPDKLVPWGKYLADLGLERTVVTVRGEEDNPISSDAKVRAKSVENNKITVECCQALGATHMVGPFYAGLGVFSGTGPTEEEFNWSVEGMQKVAEHAGKCGVKLSIEFLNRFEIYLLNCAADTVRYVKAVDHPNCGILYDTFHANVEEKSMAEAIRTAGSLINHVHISENDRSTPGSGSVNWLETFDTLKEIKFDGWLTIEAFGLALKELIAATKIWRKMYQSEEQLASDGLAFMKSEWAKRG